MPVAPQCNQNASALIYALTMYFSHALIGLKQDVAPEAVLDEIEKRKR